MSTPEPARDVEQEFRNLVQAAVDQRWEREGRYSAKEILADIRENQANDDLWQLMAEQLAARAAAGAIQRQMKVRTQTVHPAQQAFPFAGELPVPAINYKRSVVSTLRATIRAASRYEVPIASPMNRTIFFLFCGMENVWTVTSFTA